MLEELVGEEYPESKRQEADGTKGPNGVKISSEKKNRKRENRYESA